MGRRVRKQTIRGGTPPDAGPAGLDGRPATAPDGLAEEDMPLTDRQRALLQAVVLLGPLPEDGADPDTGRIAPGHLRAALRAAGVDNRTLMAWLDPEAPQHSPAFAAAWAGLSSRFVSAYRPFVLAQVAADAAQGNTRAQALYAEIAGDTGTRRVEHTGPDGGPIPLTLRIAGLSDAELAALEDDPEDDADGDGEDAPPRAQGPGPAPRGRDP